jgi:hypothetical protein
MCSGNKENCLDIATKKGFLEVVRDLGAGKDALTTMEKLLSIMLLRICILKLFVFSWMQMLMHAFMQQNSPGPATSYGLAVRRNKVGWKCT